MLHFIRKIILLGVLLHFFSQVGLCQPKVGLALGGGGAKGAATIGVLKVIEEAGIKVDYVAGTSIGAIIGGLYASGYSIQEMEDMFLSQEWKDILDGDKVESNIQKWLARYGVEQFKDTRIPFRCVAAKENNFEEVVLYNGLLYKAIRASMSIPRVYESVKWDDMYLVDGGVANNLPVDVVKEMGADIVIAIDLQQPNGISLGISVRELFNIGVLADWFLSRPDLPRYYENIKETDVHINPRLPDFSAASFGHDNCELMMQLGEEKAREHWDELIEIRNRQR